MLGPTLERYLKPYRGIPREVWGLSIGAMINRAGTMVLPWLAVFLTEERGFGIEAAGLVLATYGVGGILGALLGGHLSDRFDPVRVQIASLIGAGLFCWPIGYIDDRVTLIAVIFLFSVVSESMRPAVHAACSMFSAENSRQQSFTLLRLMVNFGMAIGPVVGGFLAAHKSYTMLFIVDGATSGAAAIVLWAWLGRKHHVHARKVERAQDRLEPGLSPWRDRGFLFCMLLTLLTASLFFQIASSLTLYLRREYGFRQDTIGLVLLPNTVTIVFLEMHIVTWLGRFAKLKAVAVGSLLLGLGFFLTIFGRTVPWAVFTVLIWTFGEMASASMLSAWVADRAGAARRGAYMGLYTAVWAIAYSLAPWAGTRAYERTGPDSVFWGCGVTGVVLLLGFLALDRFRRSAADSEAVRS